MILQRLTLQHFRNYSELDIELHPRVNYILGDNAQGKTNLLEAVYCLGLTRSFRAQTDQELVEIGNSSAYVKGSFQNELGVRHQVALAWTQGRKLVTFDQKRLVRHADLIGKIPVVLFHPEDHRITGGSPAERRRFLDILLSQSDWTYLRTLQQFQRVLKQRNRLLQRIQTGEATIAELDVWDQTYIKLAYEITRLRVVFLEEIGDLLSRYYNEIAGEPHTLSVAYACREQQRLDDESKYAETVVALRKEEIARGQTLVGPHRDDVVLYLNGKDVRKHASRGEQKSLLLALKLVEFFYLNERRQTAPILLFDDIYSELDRGQAAQRGFSPL